MDFVYAWFMDADAEILVRKKFDLLKPVFDEQVRRLWSAAEAQALGHRGISVVARATGLSRTTIHQGVKEIEGLREKKALEKVPAHSCAWRRAETDLRA